MVRWLILSLALLIIYSGCKNTIVVEPTPSTKILAVPVVPQTTDFSCGAAATLSVLKFYGIHGHDETMLIERLGTDPNVGTEIERIVAFSEQVGLKATLGTRLTLEQIEQSILQNQPVLVEFQAWTDTPERSYRDNWDDGHYAVVVGIDAEKLYFVDPANDGTRGFITRAEFLERWHDVDQSGKHRYHTAVLFTGTPTLRAAGINDEWEEIP